MDAMRYDELKVYHPAERAAWAAIEGFKGTYARWFPKKGPDALWDDHIADALGDYRFTPQQMLDTLRGEPLRLTALEVFLIGIQFAVKAVQTCRGKYGTDDPWPLAVEAIAIDAKLTGFNPDTRAKSTSTTKDALSAIGSLGGKAKHRQSNADKDRVKGWCEENLAQHSQVGSLNKLCAAVIAAKISGTEEGTIRKWLTEWAKQWRIEGRWPA